jgi:phosphatidylglycerophosphate synthase
VSATDTVLLVHAGYLFEQRTISALARQQDALLECPRDGGLAGAIANGARAAEFAAALTTASATRPTDARLLRPAELEHYDDHLRRVEPPLLEPMREEQRDALESVLYGNAYKGITDLVTKWLWPRPARRVVGWCANAGITPNMVTVTGLLLVLAATWLFAHGAFVSGLACGWLMTLLDTVDGKLARVTVQSSKLGHWLDHGMDIVHPPFWYVLWGTGLGASIAPDTGQLMVQLIIGGYIAGRALEALFHALGSCSMFAWRPFDAYFRLGHRAAQSLPHHHDNMRVGGSPRLGFLRCRAVDRRQQRGDGLAPRLRRARTPASWSLALVADRSGGRHRARTGLSHVRRHPRCLC